MLLTARHMYGALVDATDGKLGKLCDVLFDDQTWNIRSLVLDAGTWLNSRRVVLPPDIIHDKDWADHRLVVTGLTRQQVIDSPGIETHVPISQPAPVEEATIIDWGLYWSDVFYHPWQVADDPHVRNTQEVVGYHIQCSDGAIGHVEDFLVDDAAWAIRFLVLDTRNWWPGKLVLVAPARIETIDGYRRMVRLALSREEIRQSPPFDPSLPMEKLQEVAAGSAP